MYFRRKVFGANMRKTGLVYLNLLFSAIMIGWPIPNPTPDKMQDSPTFLFVLIDMIGFCLFVYQLFNV